MTDWLTVALRFAAYGDLLLLFGLAAYPLYASAPPRFVGGRGVISTLALLGLGVSGVAFLQLVASMSGVSIAEIDGDTLFFVLTGTPPGKAFIVRSLALLAITGTAISGLSGRAGIVPLLSAVALATLAWTGHAAVTEGAAGSVHRLSDIIHLLAAGAWLGALAVLLALLFSKLDGDEGIAITQSALANFGAAGSVFVALIVLSGIINGWMIVGIANLPSLPFTLYGQLLIAKLLLFGAMLAHAAVNRWRLTPRLAGAHAVGDANGAVRLLRISIVSEFAIALLVIALVSWLGTLEPVPMS